MLDPKGIVNLGSITRQRRKSSFNPIDRVQGRKLNIDF